MNELVRQGCLDIWIDDVVPCLRDTVTGELKDTVAFKIESRSYLKNFKKKDGWHINWSQIPSDVEVYALALQENNEIQGLIGLRNDKDAQAVYMHWACVAPHNNRHDFGKQKYVGVGGHLFAIAVDKSFQWGYDGVVYGFAANSKLEEHYVSTFNAEHIGVLHEYQFIIDEDNAKKLLEVYHYEWNEKDGDTNKSQNS